MSITAQSAGTGTSANRVRRLERLTGSRPCLSDTHSDCNSAQLTSMPPKLKTLSPRIATMAPRLGYAKDDTTATSRYRHANSPSKAWYNTAWWKHARQRILARDLYTCQMCGVLVAGKGEAHIDHIEPHRDDRNRFFCGDNGLQTLCANCHNMHKQAEERGSYRPTIGLDGWPEDKSPSKA